MAFPPKKKAAPKPDFVDSEAPGTPGYSTKPPAKAAKGNPFAKGKAPPFGKKK
jgi:hypothetical protein